MPAAAGGKDPVSEIIRSAFRTVETGKIDVNRIQSFSDYPFDVENGEAMTLLAEDIRKNGMESPVIVRKIMDPRYDYEMLDGHRRAYALKKTGAALADAYILDCDDQTAAVILCESNLQVRKDLRLSEAARVYGMELEALKRIFRMREASAQGKSHEKKNSGEKTTRALLAGRHGLSAVNLSRIIRLRLLSPQLQQAADNKKIPFNVAVALTHLGEEEQALVLDFLNRGGTLSLKSAEELKKAARHRLVPLSREEMEQILGDGGASYTGEQLVKAACEKACSSLLEQNSSCAAGGTYTQQDAELLARFILEAVAELSEGAPLDS